jgi:hypothetical protein
MAICLFATTACILSNQAWEVAVRLVNWSYSDGAAGTGVVGCGVGVSIGVGATTVVDSVDTAHDFRDELGIGEFDNEFDDISDRRKLYVTKIMK